MSECPHSSWKFTLPQVWRTVAMLDEMGVGDHEEFPIGVFLISTAPLTDEELAWVRQRVRDRGWAKTTDLNSGEPR